jgi:hypothetical protein
MKKLEKKVHFVAEGTSVGCYDSKGSPVRYIMVSGTPYIELDKSVDRLFKIDGATAHCKELKYYSNYRSDMFSSVELSGVINGTFVSSNSTHYYYAERPCTHQELASFYLAMYKVQKNTIKMEDIK